MHERNSVWQYYLHMQKGEKVGVFNLYFLFMYMIQTGKLLWEGLASFRKERKLDSKTVVKWREEKPQMLVYVVTEMKWASSLVLYLEQLNFFPLGKKWHSEVNRMEEQVCLMFF